MPVLARVHRLGARKLGIDIQRTGGFNDVEPEAIRLDAYPPPWTWNAFHCPTFPCIPHSSVPETSRG